MIRHGRCGKSWTGANRGHCSGCCETFTSGAFDKHQHISAGTVTCSTDGLIGKPQPWGTLWALPGSSADYWQARRTMEQP